MADLASIRLPADLSAAQGSGEMKKLKSYLYQLTEQLRYVLTNLDSDNMSPAYTQSAAAQGLRIDRLTEAQKENFDALSKKIVASANKIAHEYTAALQTESDRIRAAVTEEYTAHSADLQAGLESLVQSSLTQTSRELKLSLTQLSQLAQQTAQAVETLDSHTETWFRFTQKGLEIGKNEDGTARPYTMRIDDQRLSFLRYGAVVAYFQYNRLYVTAVEAADRVSIGGSAGEGFYDFITTATGLGIKWRAN